MPNSQNLLLVKINELIQDPNFDVSRLLISGDAANGDMYKIDSQAVIDLVISQMASQSVAFKGEATTSTDPGTPSSNEFYFAFDTGTYTNFLDDTSTAIEVTQNDTWVMLIWNGSSWSKESIDIDALNVSDIIDSLNSTATDKALSANQGKVIGDKLNPLYEGFSYLDYTEETAVDTFDEKLVKYNEIVFTSFSAINTTKYDVSGLDKVYITADIRGEGVALAVFADAGNSYISYYKRGTQNITESYVKELVSIPQNAKYLYISHNNSAYPYAFVYSGIKKTYTHDDFISISDIIDNLNSTATDKALSANQGKVIGDKLNPLYEGAKKEVYDVINYLNAYDNKTIIYYDNSLTSFSAINTTKYDVSGLDKVYITAHIRGEGAALAVFLDENNNNVGYYKRGTQNITKSYVKELVSIPQNAKYLYASNLHDEYDYSKVYTLTEDGLYKLKDVAIKTNEIDAATDKIKYIEEAILEKKNKEQVDNSGNIITNNETTTIKVKIDPNKEYYMDTVLKKSGLNAVHFFDSSDNYLGNDNTAYYAMTYYRKVKINIKQGTSYIYVNRFIMEKDPLYASVYTAKIVKYDFSSISSIVNGVNYWKGKKIVSLGTSVIQGAEAEASYIDEARRKLGFELIQTGLPGQAIQTVDDGSGGEKPSQYGSSTLSIAEYNSYGWSIDTNKRDWVPNGNYTSYYRTWEHIFEQENADADLWIWGVLPNNTVFDDTDWNDFDKDNWQYNTGSFEDHRKTYLGALIYMFNKLYELNPKARSVFVIDSEFKYEDGALDTKKFCDEFKIPLVDMYSQWNLNKFTKQYLISHGGTNPHPSTYAHEIMGRILTGELLSKG